MERLPVQGGLKMENQTYFLKEELSRFIRESGEQFLSGQDTYYDDGRFNDLAMKLFRYQWENNRIYARYCQNLKVDPESIRRWEDIPPMPIDVFKQFTLSAVDLSESQNYYITSGTTKTNRGYHYLDDLSLYHLSIYYGFKNWVLPDIEKTPILVLFPSKEEMPHSSLAHFFDHLEHTLGTKDSFFYIQNDSFLKDRLYKDLTRLSFQQKPVLIAGTSFSFVYWFDYLRDNSLSLSLPKGSRMLDTGGFKGRTRSITPEQMAQLADSYLGIPRPYVLNYYGMTELGSQFYDRQLRDYIKNAATESVGKINPPWARVRVVDPFTLEEVPKGCEGAIVVYDLVNQNSLLAIRTEDRGVITEDGFLVLGRLPKSEERGCSRALESVLLSKNTYEEEKVTTALRQYQAEDKSTDGLQAYWLPGLINDKRVQLPDLEIKAEVPYLTKENIESILTQLNSSRQYVLGLSVRDIAQIIEKAAELWKAPGSFYMQEALRVLPALTGYSAAQVKKALEYSLNQLTADNLIRLLDRELGSFKYLDGFYPGLSGKSMAQGPTLTFAVFSGNIPGIAFSHIAQALLLKGCLLGKCSRGEPYSAVLFSQSLKAIDPQLAQCIALTWWPGGDEELEEEIFPHIDALIVYGGDQAVRSYQKRSWPHTTFIGYSHRYSFAVIGQEMLDQDKLAECVDDMIEAVDHLQQQGCVSPQVFFVEGNDENKLRELGDLLNRRLNRQDEKYESPDNLAAISAVRRVLDQYELHRLKGESLCLFGQPGDFWLVLVNPSEPQINLENSWAVLGRVIWLQAIDHLENVPKVLPVPKQWLQTVGIKVSSEREEHLAELFARFGASRVCPISKMQWPSPFWHHDGRPQVSDLIKWVDKE
jgi:hypothetical protein